jgi:6-phosphogluconolactonase
VRAYVGALTGDPAAGNVGIGLTVLGVEPGSGALESIQTLSDLHSPTYLAVHPSLPVLYAGERHWPPMGAQSPGSGSITTLAIDPQSGYVRVQARRPSGGPTHLSVHPGGRYVVAAMNRVLQVGAFPLEADGSVGEPSAIIQHTGRGPRSPAQDRAFPHSCWFDRSGTRVLCCDLGLDRIMLYDFDPATGSLQAGVRPYAQLSSGAGPRHLALHPNDHVVYVLNELDSTISVFDYTAQDGRMAILQTLSSLPADFAGESAAAQILVHPSGRSVYASNRGHDSIATFKVDQATGRLHAPTYVSSGGQRPHNFTMDAAGTLLLVANQRSGSVVSFSIDSDNGALAATGAQASIPGAVCVVLSSDSAATGSATHQASAPTR